MDKSGSSLALLKPNVIGSAYDCLILLNILASDFEPRTLSQMLGMPNISDQGWSQTKLHNMLSTLAAADWLRQDASTGAWAISPAVVAISVGFYEHVNRRSQAILAEVSAVQNLNNERISNAK